MQIIGTWSVFSLICYMFIMVGGAIHQGTYMLTKSPASRNVIRNSQSEPMPGPPLISIIASFFLSSRSVPPGQAERGRAVAGRRGRRQAAGRERRGAAATQGQAEERRGNPPDQQHDPRHIPCATG